MGTLGWPVLVCGPYVWQPFTDGFCSTGWITEEIKWHGLQLPGTPTPTHCEKLLPHYGDYAVSLWVSRWGAPRLLRLAPLQWPHFLKIFPLQSQPTCWGAVWEQVITHLFMLSGRWIVLYFRHLSSHMRKSLLKVGLNISKLRLNCHEWGLQEKIALVGHICGFF